MFSRATARCPQHIRPIDRRSTTSAISIRYPVAYSATESTGGADRSRCGEAEGRDSKVVAQRLHVTPATVCKWRGRFVRDRLDGLYDEPRPGAPRTITDDQIEEVII